jgi:hypothetical protein
MMRGADGGTAGGDPFIGSFLSGNTKKLLLGEFADKGARTENETRPFGLLKSRSVWM